MICNLCDILILIEGIRLSMGSATLLQIFGMALFNVFLINVSAIKSEQKNKSLNANSSGMACIVWGHCQLKRPFKLFVHPIISVSPYVKSCDGAHRFSGSYRVLLTNLIRTRFAILPHAQIHARDRRALDISRGVRRAEKNVGLNTIDGVSIVTYDAG